MGCITPASPLTRQAGEGASAPRRARARLTGRLRLVAATLPAGVRSVADVAAGDGTLARHLAARGLRVVATELRPGAFARLHERLTGVDAAMDCRLGDGLEVLRPGEVEAGVIAGLGGRTIASILERSSAVAGSLRWLVLQPQQREEALLAWLDGHGFLVERTSEGSERGRGFRVLLVRPPAGSARGRLAVTVGLRPREQRGARPASPAPGRPSGSHPG